MARKIAALVLIMAVFSAGCLVQMGGKPSASGGFSVNVTTAPFNVPVNITAVMVNVTASFFGYHHLTVQYS